MEDEKREGYQLIRSDVIADLFKTQYRLSYMVLVMEHICNVRKVETMVKAKELCEILQITMDELEEAAKKQWIKYVTVSGIKVYRAYDIAILAEKMHRRRRLWKLAKVPTFTINN